MKMLDRILRELAHATLEEPVKFAATVITKDSRNGDLVSTVILIDDDDCSVELEVRDKLHEVGQLLKEV